MVVVLGGLGFGAFRVSRVLGEVLRGDLNRR